MTNANDTAAPAQRPHRHRTTDELYQMLIEADLELRFRREHIPLKQWHIDSAVEIGLELQSCGIAARDRAAAAAAPRGHRPRPAVGYGRR